MTIRIEDLDNIDFSDVTTGEVLRPIHLGEILREEFLLPLAMTAHALALVLKIPAPRINDIVRERRAIIPDTALRLARYFGTTADFWTRQQISAVIEREVLPREGVLSRYYESST